MNLSHLAYRIARRLCSLEISQLSLLELPPIGPAAGGTIPRCWNRTGPTTSEATRWQEKFDFGWLTPQQIGILSEQAESRFEPELLERLRSNRYRCMVARDRKSHRLAGHLLLAWGGIEPEHNRGFRAELGFGIALPPQFAFLFNAYVLRTHRGDGLYRALLEHIKEPLRQVGTEGVIATTEWINTAALRSIRRAGFSSLGRCCRYGVGHHAWGNYPPGLRQRGLACNPSPELLAASVKPAPMLPPPALPMMAIEPPSADSRPILSRAGEPA